MGQLAVRCAFMLGAERVIAIDRVPAKLVLAQASGAETINYEKESVSEALMMLTGSRGPDSCMDAVGLEAHSGGAVHYYDRLKQALMLESDRPYAFREAVIACRSGGTVSVPGV